MARNSNGDGKEIFQELKDEEMEDEFKIESEDY